MARKDEFWSNNLKIIHYNNTRSQISQMIHFVDDTVIMAKNEGDLQYTINIMDE